MVQHRSVALAIAMAAGACTVERTATTSQAIVGGEPSLADEYLATGMVTATGGMVCTGTLIAPDVVLTAAHCLEPPIFGELGFTLDTDESDGTDDIIAMLAAHQHPDFHDTTNEFVDLAARNDIGILILERPIHGVPVEVINRPALDISIEAGDQFELCGYGRRDWHAGAVGLKRDAMVTVDRTDLFEFSTMSEGPQPCIGDSGAPLFAASTDGRRLVGLVSRAMGTSAMCNTGAIITRVNQYTSWIEMASKDRGAGCSAGGGSSLVPLGALVALLARRRRRAAC